MPTKPVEGETAFIKKEQRAIAKVWLHGLMAAIVGGFAQAGANAITSLIWGDGIKEAVERAGLSCLLAAGASAFFYLKTSPVPALPKDLVALASQSVTTITTEVTTATTPAATPAPEEKKAGQ